MKKFNNIIKSIPSNNPEYPPINADNPFLSVIFEVINIIIHDAIIIAKITLIDFLNRTSCTLENIMVYYIILLKKVWYNYNIKYSI